MQGTQGISFENCGRRFYLRDFRGDNLPDTVSGRGQNWIDADGSASGLFEPTIIVSGLTSAASWLEVDSDGECQHSFHFEPQPHVTLQLHSIRRDLFDLLGPVMVHNEAWVIFECYGTTVYTIRLETLFVEMVATSLVPLLVPCVIKGCREMGCQ